MSSSSLTKPMPVKRLGELLQEQQEPFCLDVYLVESGYLRKTLDSRLTTSGGANLQRPRKRTPPCPKILKTVLKKFVPNKTASSCEFGVSNKSVEAHYDMEPVRFSSASSMTVCDSYSESDIEEFPPLQPDQVNVTDRTQECSCSEDNKQHSPVSVLEELHSDEGSPFYNHIRCCPRSNLLEIPSSFTKRLNEESLLSASLSDLEHASTGVRELLGPASSSSSQYRKTKRALEETKQLFFDSVREVLEKQGRNENKLLGAEQMGKIICEQICFWSKQTVNLANISQLLSSELLDPTEKWKDTLPQRREIEIEISNIILDEMEFEIVSDLVDCSIR